MSGAGTALRRGEVLSAARGSTLGDIVALLVPALICVRLQLVGTLYGSEIAALALLPVLLMMRGHLLGRRPVALFIALCLLWAFGQVATDLLRETAFEDYSRGWSKIAFTLTNFCAIFLLLNGQRRRVVLFQVGAIVGGVLGYLINPSVFEDPDPWKFGVAGPVTVLLVLMSQVPVIRRRLQLSVGLLLFTALLNVYLGSRGLGGWTLLTAVFMVVERYLGRISARNRRNFLLALPIIAVVGGVSALALGEAYSYAAQRGLLGEEAEEKYKQQAEGNLGLLVSARPEILVSSQAILDSPIIGHGSWARDPYYMSMYIDLAEAGYGFQAVGIVDDLIPTHSHLFGAWVEAGILGAVFWAWCLVLAGRVFLNLWLTREPIGGLLVFMAMNELWDIPFSPYGSERRFLTPFILAVMIITWQGMLRQRAAAARPAPAAPSGARVAGQEAD
jgi:hypothetical protein